MSSSKVAARCGPLPSLLLGAQLFACSSAPRDPQARQEAANPPATVRLDLDERHQTLEGFGAAVAWYANWLTEHPNKQELYDIVFADLGIDILRLRNRFRYLPDFDLEAAELVEAGRQSLGRELTVLMSSWSPPAELKANDREDCSGEASCTLRRIDGEFPYARFADYWSDSLDAYQELGVVPHFISIQNEPDYLPDGWEGCRFSASEDASYPGYDRALDAVFQRLAERDDPPKLLGPETIGVHNARVQRYANEMNLGQIYGIAHHLYDGQSWQAPDDFQLAMRSLKASYPEHPVFQTEFSASSEDGGPFEIAWLIHNSLVEAGAVAYIYWDLIWAGSGLVAVEFPGAEENWQSERGYQIRPPYYSLKHFARFTDPGYVRVGATSSRDSLRVSAFESPDGDAVTMVMLNLSGLERRVTLEADLDDYESQIFLTTDAAAWQELGGLPDDDALTLPGRSIATLVFQRD